MVPMYILFPLLFSSHFLNIGVCYFKNIYTCKKYFAQIVKYFFHRGRYLIIVVLPLNLNFRDILF